MKIFYILTLTFGLCMAVLMQFVDIALPRDAFVASVLARAPESWTVSVDDGLKDRLHNGNVKAYVAIALQRRASFRKELYLQSFWEGIGITVFSVIGLLRERKIDILQKIVRETGALNAALTATPPA